VGGAMKIGQRVSAKRIGYDEERRVGELVYFFEKDFVPDVEAIKRYYGAEVSERFFRPFFFDRAVIKQDNGTYFVAPISINWEFKIIYPDKKEIIQNGV
jgi:hypothetical protein